MLQFTLEQVEALPNKPGANKIRYYLQQKLAQVEGHFIIPPSNASTWSGFYACPEHSVRLEFDIASPRAHKCPADGKMITGEVFDGAWWRLVNDLNQQSCYYAALLYLLDKNPANLQLARRYLLEYAKVYPGYEIHGNIPYNNPGKANAQTLCDAGWIKGLVLGYDIIREELPEEECRLIEEDLFRCCASFLMEYRTDQIHNHEVVIDSAIAMIGLLLQDNHLLAFGLSEPFGMRYQLENGLLADNLWFEGTPGYHFYMIEQVMFFELFACGTEHSFFHNQRFIEALSFPLHMLQPDGKLPPLNDVGAGYSGFAGMENIYELAYRAVPKPELLALLQCVYQGRTRCNVYAFFYGVEELPFADMPEAQPYHGGGEGESGLTTMLGPQGRFLLVKHSPFGGEHDHYDRLGIHFMGLGVAPLPDLGTSLYGAPLHYQYYKNTMAHNTVCLNGQNQPPANCMVYDYEANLQHTLLDAGVRWDDSYQPMNTHVIPQWSYEVYSGAAFRRVINWYGDFFVDIYEVVLPQSRTIDYTLHVRGVLQPGLKMERETQPWSTQGAGRVF